MHVYWKRQSQKKIKFQELILKYEIQFYLQQIETHPNILLFFIPNFKLNMIQDNFHFFCIKICLFIGQIYNVLKFYTARDIF